jgi:hypothetical protein
VGGSVAQVFREFGLTRGGMNNSAMDGPARRRAVSASRLFPVSGLNPQRLKRASQLTTIVIGGACGSLTLMAAKKR